MRRVSRAKSRLLDDTGSAVVEFVILALPLFIPLFIYLNQYSESADMQSAMKTLSREMARAVVTSENDSVAFSVAEEIFIKGGGLLGYQPQIASGEISYRLLCRDTPCISPNNEIEISISVTNPKLEISAVEYVSAWA